MIHRDHFYWCTDNRIFISAARTYNTTQQVTERGVLKDFTLMKLSVQSRLLICGSFLCFQMVRYNMVIR